MLRLVRMLHELYRPLVEQKFADPVVRALRPGDYAPCADRDDNADERKR